MLKSFFYLLILSFIVVSCNFFNSELSKETIPKIDTIVDFNSVDAFPLFPDCKDIPSREKQQVCFQVEMAQHIYSSLKSYTYNSKEALTDTVFVQLKVDTNGKTSLTNLKISEKTTQLLPEFDSLVRVSLKHLPKLKPAIKRNIPVSTEFTLPIILKN